MHLPPASAMESSPDEGPDRTTNDVPPGPGADEAPVSGRGVVHSADDAASDRGPTHRMADDSAWAPAPAAAGPAPEPEWLRGPAATPIVIGVLGLLAALMCGLAVSGTVRLNWVLIGPALIIGFGVLIVALGLLSARGPKPE